MLQFPQSSLYYTKKRGNFQFICFEVLDKPYTKINSHPTPNRYMVRTTYMASMNVCTVILWCMKLSRFQSKDKLNASFNMSVTKISFRAVTNIVKAGCKSNKLI